MFFCIFDFIRVQIYTFLNIYANFGGKKKYYII